MKSRKSASQPIITPEQVIAGYQQGFFPMARGRYGRIEWFMADPRTIIPLDHRFRVRRSLRQTLRKVDCEIRFNTDFPQVIRACARHDQVDPEEVWLSDEIIALYIELHRRGFAHSIEVWSEDRIVGGLYGVALKSAFFGESMFTRVPSASQVALVALVERLRQRGYRLLDAQMRTPHIGYFGAIDLTHEDYLAVLAEAMLDDCKFAD
ncbi:MAG TPA: leucyl/phenylalanyl-tRNA--protein transferase [Blastocatellia bacterium]|nr:leucyl/phenylalanyl-tRNA--protein transferase [Blastocatellia bacterium]